MTSHRDSFPHFHNGDVEIALTPINCLRLHSDILRDSSLHFERLLTDENAAVLSKAALKKGITVRWRIELINVPWNSALEGIGELVSFPLDSKGNVVNSDNLPRASMHFEGASKDPSRHIVDDWYSALGAIYGCEIDIGNMRDLGLVLSRASSIVNITEYLQFKKSIFAPIELALLAGDQMLWRSVNKDPITWMSLACRIRCFPIFREAAIHIIGDWKTYSAAEKASLSPEVHDFCKRKADKFADWKDNLEVRLMEYRPKKIVFQPGMLPKGKKDHEPDVFVWQTVTLFKDWLMRSFREGMGANMASDGGYGLYKVLSKGNDAYLPLMEQNKVSALTAPGKAVIADLMRELKKDVSQIVGPAMLSELRLDIKQWPPGKLTCFTILPRQAPWAVRTASRRGTPASRPMPTPAPRPPPRMQRYDEFADVGDDDEEEEEEDEDDEGTIHDDCEE